MKRLSYHIALLVALLVAVPRVSCAMTSPAYVPKPAGTVIGVEELMKNVQHYTGTVTVEGSVDAVDTGARTLALIDTCRLKKCGSKDCSALSLPVSWAGDMPSVKETVRVSGTVKKIDGKMIFIAGTLEKVDQEGGAAK